MTELDNQEVIDNEEIIDETIDNQEEDYEEEDVISWEQAQEWKRKAERAEKAEKRLVELKKQLKEKEKKTYVDKPINSKDEVKRILAEERFYEKNSEAENYRDKIESYQDKGLSLEDAYLLATKNDKQIEDTREVYGKSIIKGDNATEGINLISIEQYDRMTEQEVNKYNEVCKTKYGAVKFK